MSTKLLDLVNITKSYDGVTILNDSESLYP